ncbi:hypothetical protein DWY73_03565 [Bacteroides fragilis]|uniref:Uncharacterized protein n=5 Tax=Bacteroides fragilis TaxID=817 RepID=D1JSA8_BACFG|nr:hypothetical protein AE940_12015 [Bacteroides fragilis]CAH08949.1 hypothetical protein BF9343_3168 [Bacteroides fragilis NCTC 9343]BAD50176.1 conserved hypothetical protein [Bacteroides fragilis YCH46]EEZ24951.1 hypothetical protein HMPREF0101_02859 [Bacteroides fragilis]KAA4739730.1 hypothetical protein F3B36_17750 [Bacteroides fragilis]
MKRVKHIQKNRVLAAYLLLLTLMPFFWIKTLHTHDRSECMSSGVQHRCNPEEGCAICLFTLSPFTEAENFEYICLPVSVPVGYLQQEERSFTTSLIFHSLRAPPFVTV